MIQKQPRLAGLTFSLSETITWFEGLVAALDCYTWVLGEQLIAPSEVFHCRLMHADTRVALLFRVSGYQ